MAELAVHRRSPYISMMEIVMKELNLIFFNQRILCRDSRAENMVQDDNSTRYLQEMTILMREEFPYSSIYPVLGDKDFNPPGQAKPEEDEYKTLRVHFEIEHE